MIVDVMITTTDNPYNPFTNFDEWLDYDRTQMRYGTLELLARVGHFSDDLSEKEYLIEKELAIDAIIRDVPVYPARNENVKYTKVYKRE